MGEEEEASSSGEEEFLSKKEARSRKRRAKHAEETEVAVGDGDGDGDGDGKVPVREEKRRKKSLPDGRAVVPGKRGVVYLSRIPPHMKPLKLRHLLEVFGEVLRIYLAPKDLQQGCVKNVQVEILARTSLKGG